MRDYTEMVETLRLEADGFLMDDVPDMLMVDTLNDAADAIEELCKQLASCSKPVASCSRWISVEDRLPEPRFAREWYLVALKSGCVKTLAYEAKPTVKGALFHEGWHEAGSPVTHWMPLPEPPGKEVLK